MATEVDVFPLYDRVHVTACTTRLHNYIFLFALEDFLSQMQQKLLHCTALVRVCARARVCV